MSHKCVLAFIRGRSGWADAVKGLWQLPSLSLSLSVFWKSTDSPVKAWRSFKRGVRCLYFFFASLRCAFWTLQEVNFLFSRLCQQVKHNSFKTLWISFFLLFFFFFFDVFTWGQFVKVDFVPCFFPSEQVDKKKEKKKKKMSLTLSFPNHLCSVKTSQCTPTQSLCFLVVVAFSLSFVMKACCTDYQHFQIEEKRWRNSYFNVLKRLISNFETFVWFYS